MLFMLQTVGIALLLLSGIMGMRCCLGNVSGVCSINRGFASLLLAMAGVYVLTFSFIVSRITPTL